MINLWGEYDSFAEYQISAEGKVSLPTIGDLKFKGLTLAEAEVLLRTEVEKYYRNVKSGISLISLRSFVVSVLGSVKQPGNYRATLDHRVSDLIDLAGGVLPGGSRRHIQVLQDGKVRTVSDLSAFLRRGKLDDNPYLQDGDVVYVPPVRPPFVAIYDDASSFGEENTAALPITYELMEGQQFSSVIYDLGGVNPAWDMDNVYIIRQTPGEDEPRRIPVNLSQLVREQDGGNDLVIQSGDQLFFPVDLRRPFLNGLGELVGAAKNNRRGRQK
jgi:protein involved in polysaccharide export with SLBB domain